MPHKKNPNEPTELKKSLQEPSRATSATITGLGYLITNKAEERTTFSTPTQSVQGPH